MKNRGSNCCVDGKLPSRSGIALYKNRCLLILYNRHLLFKYSCRLIKYSQVLSYRRYLLIHNRCLIAKIVIGTSRTPRQSHPSLALALALALSLSLSLSLSPLLCAPSFSIFRYANTPCDPAQFGQNRYKLNTYRKNTRSPTDGLGGVVVKFRTSYHEFFSLPERDSNPVHPKEIDHVTCRTLGGGHWFAHIFSFSSNLDRAVGRNERSTWN